MHLARADAKIRLGDKSGARDDLLKAIAMPMEEAFDLGHAVRMLRTVDQESLVNVKDAPGVATLSFDGRLSLSRDLVWSRHGLISKIGILRETLESQEMTVAQQRTAKFELGLAYNQSSRCQQLALLDRDELDEWMESSLQSPANRAQCLPSKALRGRLGDNPMLHVRPQARLLLCPPGRSLHKLLSGKTPPLIQPLHAAWRKNLQWSASP